MFPPEMPLISCERSILRLDLASSMEGRMEILDANKRFVNYPFFLVWKRHSGHDELGGRDGGQAAFPHDTRDHEEAFAG